jgi:hypothetical protein
MDEKTDINAIRDSIGSPFGQVCMYACPADFDTQWPNPAQTEIVTTPVQIVGVDIDKIQECVRKIKECAEKLGSLDRLFGSHENRILIKYDLKANGMCDIFAATANTEIAQGIVELLKSYYENEIIILQDELKKICGG